MSNKRVTAEKTREKASCRRSARDDFSVLKTYTFYTETPRICDTCCCDALVVEQPPFLLVVFKVNFYYFWRCMLSEMRF